MSWPVLKQGLQRHERRLRFLAAGAVNTFIGLAFFPVLLWFSPWLYRNYMIGLVISQVSCTFIAFTMYKNLVFKVDTGNILREFYKFVSFYMFNYLVNFATLPFLVRVLGISPIIAQFGFAVVLTIGSYFWHSRVTFRRGAGAA